MSRLVLGGATFGRLSQIEVNKLLETALECGIDRIDTAHGYEGSEERIGFFLRSKMEFEVNSKVGRPNFSLFTPQGIRSSVETSLRRLGVDSLGTLFVHSLDAKYLTKENVETMIMLKQEGKIRRIGYSGDGVNLCSAVAISAFDDFMATFNIIDQSNAEIIQKIPIHSEIYYKLAMGQAIWTNLNFMRRIRNNKLLRFLFRKPPVPSSWTDYGRRFNKFRPEIDSDDFAASFLRFALYSGSAHQYVILGTQNSQHIRDAIRIEQDRLNPEVLEVTRYEELWSRMSSPEWQAHT